MASVRARGPSCVELEPGFKMLIGGPSEAGVGQLAWKVEVEEVLEGG